MHAPPMLLCGRWANVPAGVPHALPAQGLNVVEPELGVGAGCAGLLLWHHEDQHAISVGRICQHAIDRMGAR